MSGVTEVLHETLRQLGERRKRLEPFVDELGELDIVEKDLRKTVAKLARRSSGRPTLDLPPPRTSAPTATRGDGNGTTARERALAVLSQHPGGLAAAKIAQEADIPSAHIYPLLSQLAAGDSAVVVKIGRGFYRLIEDAAGGQVDASLSDAEREELGDRAVA